MLLRCRNPKPPMSRMGHSRPARAGTKPGHVRYAPIAIKFRSEAKCRDVPGRDMASIRLPSVGAVRKVVGQID
jgi:hypothetical protein